MAMSCVIRKASPTVIPLALRAISSPRINLTASFPSEKEASFLSNQFSSAAAVDNNMKFVKALRSQIKLDPFIIYELGTSNTKIFPFTIKDIPAWDYITLERMLHGEKIEVEVDKPSVIKEDEEEELDSDVSSSDDDDDDEEEEEEEEEKSITSPAPTIPMILTITKENSDRLKISLIASSDEVIIENVWMIKKKYINGPKFETLASDVQYGLKKFIKNIGIEESYVEFLYKYMVRKTKRKEMIWMENLEKFVEK
ncbi:hypothetical protein ACJIZ3_024075 [Penstemon smallii]|uniref:Uncharacterized protein n=1 Tax=Penstemon smallii TaxID=265156 RepID=A0ABD3TQU1_9LAMI